ncbi:MAG: APC family permease, partial [Actinomycetes bacterium]
MSTTPIPDRAGGHADHHQRDAADLADFGYRQRLNRRLGSFSAFAAGFSFISILTGMFQLTGFGYGFGGPAVWWAWMLVFVGQLLVALNFAELGARFPIAGSTYQWSKQVSGKAGSWLAGWMLLVGAVVTAAAVAIAWQIVLPPVWSGFELVKNTTTNAVILGVILLSLTTLINVVGVKVISLVNNVGVVAELVGVAAFLVLLPFHLHRGPGVIMSAQGAGPGLPGYHTIGYAAAFLMAAIMPAYVMFGFDSAGSLAEETRDPRRTVPKAILRALVVAGIAGALLLLLALMAAPSLSLATLGGGGLPYVVEAALGSTLGKILLVDVAIAIFVCGLAIQTAAIRMTFS